jgi:glycosyltransferase involved in cell wall biosynthesis
MEEKNIEGCLKSVIDFMDDIFIVDSYSTEKTLEIAKRYTDKIYQHSFDDYSKQRNWAFENLPIKTEWIFSLDADHKVTLEMVGELKEIFSKPIDKNINGFKASRQTIFMGH